MVLPPDVDTLGKALQDLRIKNSASLGNACDERIQNSTEDSWGIDKDQSLDTKQESAAPDTCDINFELDSQQTASASYGKLDADDLPLLQIVFSAVQSSLEAIAGATQSNIPRQSDRVAILKNEGLIVGNYIQTLKQKELGEPLGNALIAKFWTYVAMCWPLYPSPRGRVLEGMYRKIVEKVEDEGRKGNEDDVEMGGVV